MPTTTPSRSRRSSTKRTASRKTTKPAKRARRGQRKARAALARPAPTAPKSHKKRYLIRRWRKDPRLFARQALGIELLNPYQELILCTLARRIAEGRGGKLLVETGHGVGKSLTLAVLILWLLVCFERVTVLTTAPTYRQVEEIVWREIRKLRRKSRLPFATKPTKTKWEISEDRVAMGFSTNEPSRFQGWHNELVVALIDEAVGVKREIFEALRGSVSGPRDQMVLVGNPTDPDSYMCEASRNRGTDTEVIHVDSEDVAEWNEAQPTPIVGLVSTRWIRDMEEEFGRESVVFKSRVKGLWPDEHPENVIRQQWVLDAFLAWYEEFGEEAPSLQHFLEQQPRLTGCDVARQGGDHAVIANRCGHYVWIHDFRAKCSLTELAGLCIQCYDLVQPEGIAIDDTGLGGGVTDILVEGEYPAWPFDFRCAPDDPDKFFDGRTELWWRGRELLRLHALAVCENNRLLRDLLAPRYTVLSDGRIKMESKKDTMKRTGKSPDYGDAFMLTLLHGSHAPEDVDPDDDALEALLEESDDWNGLAVPAWSRRQREGVV